MIRCLTAVMFLVSILTTFVVQAGVVCQTPTTTFAAKQVEGVFRVEVHHPHGPRLTPIYNGPVVAYQIPDLEEKSKKLESLGKELFFEFEACKSEGIFLECSGGKEMTINNEKIKPISFRVSTVEVKSLSFNYQKARLTLSFLIDGKTYGWDTEYAMNKCHAY